MASADGRIVIDIELEDGSVVRGLGDIGEQADRVGNRSSSAFAKAGSALKTVGTVAVGVVAGVGALSAAVVGLSIPLVKAAAEAQALNSQFSQVFGNLEKSAEASLQTIGNATQINAERLRGSFVRIAAFAKTTGVDTQAALDLSSRALTAAADSAAFYDRSIEDTTESLQSFLKGNYENDAALGISATETTRNATATRLFGQEFKALSEAQKQVALLEMVEEGNKLSGALGQAAREGDGLENVLGNLKQAYENFKVSLGSAILDTAIDALQTLTKVINNVDISPLVSGLTFLVGVLGKLASVIKPVAVELYNTLVSALANIRSYFESEGGNIVNTARNIFIRVYTAVSTLIQDIVPIVQLALFRINAFWQAYGTQIIATATNIFNMVRNVVVNVLPVVLEFIRRVVVDIANIWDTYFADIFNVVSTVLGAVFAVFNFFLPAIQFVVDVVWSAIVDVITGALDVIIGIVNIFTGLFTLNFSQLWDGVVQLFRGAINLIFGLISLSFVGAIRTAITNFFKFIVNFIRGQWTTIVSVFKSSASSITNVISSWISNLLSFFRSLGTNLGNIVVGIWNGIRNAFSTGVQAALQLVRNLSTNVINIVKGIDLFSIGKNIIQGLINGIGSLAGKIKDKVKEVVNLIPKGIRNLLDIHSPSRVTTELGEFAGEGIEVGLDNSIRGISKATDNVAKAAIPTNVVNRLRGSTVGVSGISAGLLNGGTNTSNVSNINNSQNPVYNINVQNNQTDAIERTIKRIQFGY